MTDETIQRRAEMIMETTQKPTAEAIETISRCLETLSKRPIATWYKMSDESEGGYYAGWDDAEYLVRQALVALSALKAVAGWGVQEGWVLVPPFISDDMATVFVKTLYPTREDGTVWGFLLEDAYKAMLSAAPKPPVDDK